MEKKKPLKDRAAVRTSRRRGHRRDAAHHALHNRRPDDL